MLAVSVFAVLAGARWKVPGQGITRENCKKIQNGMGEKQVEKLLGCAPRRYHTRPTHVNVICEDVPAEHDFNRSREGKKVWFGNRAAIYVYFDEEHLVSSCWCTDVLPMDEAFVDRLWRWLELIVGRKL